MQLVNFGSVRIGYVTCFKHFRGAGDLRQRRADQSSGATFSNGHPTTRLAVGLDDLARLSHQLLRQKIITHFGQYPIRMLATAWAAMPSRRPVKPRPSVVVAFTLTCSTLKPAISAIL